MSRLFVIGDLHFSLGTDKPMDIFGKAWENHTGRICENWRRIVRDEDFVVVNGDISWGLDLEEAAPDLVLLDSLPGTKIIMKGNHELWWTTLAKVSSVFKENNVKTLVPLYNNAVFLPEKKLLICGTRGWLMPGDEEFGDADAKVLRREIIRFELSLNYGKTLVSKYFEGNPEADRDYETIAFFHYPPFVFTKREGTEMTDIIEKNNISRCYFGHVHGVRPRESEGFGQAPVFRRNGVEYYLTAADYLRMEPAEIPAGGEALRYEQ